MRPRRSPYVSIQEPRDPTSEKLALRATREVVEVLVGRQGDGRDRAVTVRDLEEIGLIDEATARRLATRN